MGGSASRRLGAATLLALGLAMSSCAADADPEAPSDDAAAAHGALDLTPGTVVTIEGIVTSDSGDPCRFPDEHDEPCVEDLGQILTVDVDGRPVTVHYGGGEWPPCDNPTALYRAEQTRVGDRVTVVAEVVEDGHHSGADLDTCGSEDRRIDVHD